MPLKTIALAFSPTLLLTTATLAGSAQLFQDGRPRSNPGNPVGAGALSLTDNSGSWLDIGRYRYGWTIQTPYRVEFHTGQKVSVSCYNRDDGGEPCLPRFQVRNPGDTASSIWINGRNRIGSLKGPIVFAFGSYTDGGDEVGRFETNGNLVLMNDLIIENKSLKAKLADIERRLSALEQR